MRSHLQLLLGTQPGSASSQSHHVSALVCSWSKVIAQSPEGAKKMCWDFLGMRSFVREESSEPKAIEGPGQPSMGHFYPRPSSCVGPKGAPMKCGLHITFLTCESLAEE